MNAIVDVSFPLSTSVTIPADHGYRLYGALSRILPRLHESNGIGIHPVSGRQIGNGRLHILSWSRLTVRVACNRISELLPLSGKSLNLSAECAIQVGVPQLLAIKPATSLRSRLVTIKGYLEANTFSQAVRRQLDAIDVSKGAIITLDSRRTLRIKDKTVVGFGLILNNLDGEESLIVQAQGIGGRRHMGCGIFRPFLARGQAR